VKSRCQLDCVTYKWHISSFHIQQRDITLIWRAFKETWSFTPLSCGTSFDSWMHRINSIFILYLCRPLFLCIYWFFSPWLLHAHVRCICYLFGRRYLIYITLINRQIYIHMPNISLRFSDYSIFYKLLSLTSSIITRDSLLW
jgi:hypothetical protein